MTRWSQIGDGALEVRTWKPSSHAPNEKITYIDISAIDRTAKTIASPTRILGAAAPSRARQLVHANDILISTVRPNLNNVAVVPADLDGATASTGFFVFRCDAAKFDTRYVFHWVTGPIFVAEMVRQATGAGYPAVTDSIIKASPIPLLPIPEQRRIAAVLDQADAMRATRRRAIIKLKQFERSLFLDMFGDPAINSFGFPILRIGDTVTRITNGYVGPTRDIYRDTGVPYLLARHVKANRITFDGATYVSTHFNDKQAKSILNEGDVLLVQSGHIGESAVVPLEHAGHNCHAMIVLTPKQGIVLGHYLSYLFGTAYMRRRFAGIQTGITLRHLNCRDVREIEIPVPPFALQHQFRQRIVTVTSVETHMQASLAKLDALFASLQHRAFRGEL